MPKECTDEKGKCELNKNYEFHFGLMVECSVVFELVSTMSEWVLCLLSAGWCVGSVMNLVVIPIEFVVGLGFIVREASSFSGFDDESVE